MDIRPDILRRDMVQLLTQIDAQIKEVDEVALNMGIDKAQLRDRDGNWVMIPLLAARVQAVAALVQLQVRK